MARIQLDVREPGFYDSLASGTWCCQKGKAQRLERGEEAPGLQTGKDSWTALLILLRGKFKLSWSFPSL